MEYHSLKEIRKATKENLETVMELVDSAKKMQDSIADLEDDDARDMMTDNFNNVVTAINQLMKSTTVLFDRLEEFMEV